MSDVAEHACVQDCPGGKNLTLPAPIMKDRKNPLVLPSDLRKASRFRQSHGEGFIDDYILPCTESGGGERKMTFIGTGDHDQIDVGIRRHLRSRTDQNA